MLASHTISDFDPAMRSAMNIRISFRTKYSGDLHSIGKVLGGDFSKIVPNLPVGYSIFHLADVGDPFVVGWRPTYSQSRKLQTCRLASLSTVEFLNLQRALRKEYTPRRG